MESYEKLGAFYLGRPYDLKHQKPKDGLLLYDSKDLAMRAGMPSMAASSSRLRQSPVLPLPVMPTQTACVTALSHRGEREGTIASA
jgi:hypothetical protein